MMIRLHEGNITQLLLAMLIFTAIDFLIFGILSVINFYWPMELAKVMYYLDRIWRIGLIYVIFKFVFGYYVMMFLYFYVSKGASLISTALAAIVIFFISLTVMLMFGKWPSIWDAYREAVVFKAPLGNDVYIALFSSLLTPVFLRWLMKPS